MKIRLLLAILLVASPALHADTLSDARARFADGEFEQSAKLFEQYLEKAPPQAAVFFELGRTFSKLGQEARAALNFRRALILDPGFQPALTALQETNTALGIPTPPKRSWIAIAREQIPMDLLTLGATTLAWLGLFTGLLAFFSRPTKAIALCLGFLMLCVGVAGVFAARLLDPRITEINAAIVLTTGGTTMLSSPADQSEKVASLPQGTVVKILSQRGRWFYGQLPRGARGWFLTEGIVPLIPPA